MPKPKHWKPVVWSLDNTYGVKPQTPQSLIDKRKKLEERKYKLELEKIDAGTNAD